GTFGPPAGGAAGAAPRPPAAGPPTPGTGFPDMKIAPFTPTPCAQRSGCPTYTPVGPLPADCAQMKMRSGLPCHLGMLAFTQSTATEMSRPPSSQLPAPG